MGYQSKTWSLSDEVVAVFDRAKADGVSPNQLLLRVFNLVDDDEVEWRRFFDSEMDRHAQEGSKTQ